MEKKTIKGHQPFKNLFLNWKKWGKKYGSGRDSLHHSRDGRIAWDKIEAREYYQNALIIFSARLGNKHPRVFSIQKRFLPSRALTQKRLQILEFDGDWCFQIRRDLVCFREIMILGKFTGRN